MSAHHDTGESKRAPLVLGRTPTTGLSLAAVLLTALLALTLALAPRAAAYVYWTEIFGEGGKIGRADLDGTGVDKRFITGAHPNGVAVDATHIYWANWKEHAIGRANLDGTGVDQSFITGVRDPSGVAVDGAHVYWTSGAAKIGRANLDGTDVDPSFITITEFSYAVAVDAAHIYWSDVGMIGRANLDGTGVDPSFIYTGQSPVGMAVDAENIYWSVVDPSAIGRANLDGTGVDQNFIAGRIFGPFGQSAPQGVAVDDAHVYWANYDGYSEIFDYVGRANLDGRRAERFIPGAEWVSSVAVDTLPSFSFDKVKRNGRKGTAKLTVKVPGPGELELAKTKKVKPDDESAEDAGKEKLAIKPRGKAKEKLNTKGKAKVKAEVTYTPDGGEPNTQSKRVRLVKRG
jgi:virginiamycin B lyase